MGMLAGQPFSAPLPVTVSAVRAELPASGQRTGARGHPRRAELTRGIDPFRRPASLPGAAGAMRVPHTCITGVSEP